MAGRIRCSDAGYVYHVRNRAIRRAKIFEESARPIISQRDKLRGAADVADRVLADNQRSTEAGSVEAAATWR